MAAEIPRPPMADQPDNGDRPGVVPGGARPRPSGSEPEEGEEKFLPASEILVEVAPTTPFGERDPGKIVEVAPDEPEPSRPGEPSEVIPEVRPPEPEPYRPGDPSEVITEVAPEVQPSETEPTRPRDPSEVITEVAPEVAPER